LGVLAGSLAAFLALIRVIIPALGGGSYAYFASSLAFRYAELGSSPQDIMATAVRHPGRIAHLLFQAQKLKFLAGIFGPVLGLSLISGFAVVLVIPTLALLLLSNYGPQSAFTSQYSAPLIPLVIGTSILGFARLRPSIQRPVAGAVLLSSLAFAYLFGDLPFSRHFQAANFQTEPPYAAFVHNLDHQRLCVSALHVPTVRVGRGVEPRSRPRPGGCGRGGGGLRRGPRGVRPVAGKVRPRRILGRPVALAGYLPAAGGCAGRRQT